MNRYQEHMRSRRWGVFHHFLYGDPGSDMPTGADRIDWNERVELFDVDRLARDLHDIGAGYYGITLMQGRKYMAAPNAEFDRIAGTKPGEACARRDLIADLINALDRYGIDLILYFTGDGPYKDEEIGRKFGFLNPRQNVSLDFCRKWSGVLEEYALRYGDSVKAWWLDGCYDSFGYEPERLTCYYDAVKRGNPHTLVSINNGVKDDLYKWYEKEEMTSGEYNDFTVIPGKPSIDGALPHILAPLGISADGTPWSKWGRPGVSRDRAYMMDYVRRVNAMGGIVSVDVQVRYDSTFDPAQLEVIRGL